MGKSAVDQKELIRLKVVAKGWHDHARSCKKAPDQCQICKSGISWFGELPPQVLSQVLEEH